MLGFYKLAKFWGKLEKSVVNLCKLVTIIETKEGIYEQKHNRADQQWELDGFEELQVESGIHGNLR